MQARRKCQSDGAVVLGIAVPIVVFLGLANGWVWAAVGAVLFVPLGLVGRRMGRNRERPGLAAGVAAVPVVVLLALGLR